MLRRRPIQPGFTAEVIGNGAEVRLSPLGEHPGAGAIKSIDRENLDRGFDQTLAGRIAPLRSRFPRIVEFRNRHIQILIQSTDQLIRSNMFVAGQVGQSVIQTRMLRAQSRARRMSDRTAAR
jgi:hypothetical protein